MKSVVKAGLRYSLIQVAPEPIPGNTGHRVGNVNHKTSHTYSTPRGNSDYPKHPPPCF